MEDALQANSGNVQPPAWRVWWQLARPFSLTASALPVLVGSAVALAGGQLTSPGLFLVMLLASLLIQAATNMFNEYYDYRRGLDTPESVGIAGSIVRGQVRPISVFVGAIVCFSCALLLGLYIVLHTDPAVLVAGVVSALAGYLYTGGPIPIAYTPFGEVTVFLFMGPVIVGLAYYIQAGSVSGSAVWASIPVGCLVAAILLANNLRDVVADRGIGRRTMVVVLGRPIALGLYILLLAGTYVSTILAVLIAALPVTALLPVLTVRTPLRLVRLYRSTEEPRMLNAGVRGSAGLHARYGLLLALGITLGSLIR